jgi:hypothetical protein
VPGVDADGHVGLRLPHLLPLLFLPRQRARGRGRRQVLQVALQRDVVLK